MTRLCQSYGKAAVIVAGILCILSLSGGCAFLQGRERPQFRFGVLADIQYADKDTHGPRHYRAALGKLEECVDDLNRRDLAFVIQLGDIIDGYPDDQPASEEDLAVVLRSFERIEAPYYHVVGNHCLNAGADVLHRRLGLERFYYHFTVPQAKGWRFVVLDGNDAGYGVISSDQMDWFGSVLRRAAEQEEKVICFCHFALLRKAAAHHRMAKPEPVLEAIENAGCGVAWFAGHDHAGGYAVRDKVHHVTVKGMVEAPQANAYAIVEVYADRLTEIGLGAEPTREMPLPTPADALRN